MKQIIDHPIIGHIEYEESNWTGSKSLSINGAPLQKTSKKTFVTPDGTPVEIKGNYLAGSSLIIGQETIRLTPPITWYEIVLTVLLFVFIIVWSNVPALLFVVPIIGGAIGGAITGGLAVLTLFLAKMTPKPILKILVIFGMAAATFLVLFLLAFAFASLLVIV